MFNSEHCSPDNKVNKHSCLDVKMLKKIAKALNKHNKGDIKEKKTKAIKLNSSKEVLHKEISNEIKKISDCSNEKCWIKINIIKDELGNDYEDFLESFRPTMPEKWKNEPNAWLSTSDIDKVLEQYELAYPNFKYMGANPIDFDLKLGNSCVSGDICNLEIEDIKREKKKSFGMVFNTDPHNKSGQHWFSMYVDLEGVNVKGMPCIYHFDSLAREPTKEIYELVEKITDQCREINKDINFLFNNEKHQHGNTECGIYCLHFLINMLKGMDFKEYIINKRNDKEMEKFREVFYVPSW